MRSEVLIAPYNKILADIQKMGRIDLTTLSMAYGPTVINSALDAARGVGGLALNTNWPKVLEESWAMHQAGATLEKLGKKLQNGEPIDWSKVTTLSRSAQLKLSEDLIPLSDIEPGAMPFVCTGWKAFDEHVGGLPEIGLVVVGGRPGVGKTWYMVKTVTSYAKAHPDKSVAVFSLEMVLAEIAARFKGESIPESNRPDEDTQKRMLMCEKILSAEEIVQMCTTIPNLGLVCIDFADLTIRGAADEAAMSVLYKTLAAGAKEIGCTIILLSQLARRNGIPKPSDLRYTGLAEALGWMILMLYDPATDWTVEDQEDKTLPVIDRTAYIIVWKVRGGFRRHVDDSPGAICIPFRGKFGWHDRQSKWFTLRKYEQ